MSHSSITHFKRITSIFLILAGMVSCGGGEEGGTDSTSYTVGVTVTGLTGSGLVLQNNSSDNLAINAVGSFTFATALADLSSYNVTISSQPGTPNQTCSVSNSSGSLAGSNISNVAINCVANTYIISGSVSGLSGAGLVLQNNGSDNLTINADGSFTFATALADFSSYNVTISSQPGTPSQTCSVSNGSGTLTGNNISNVAVNCVTNTYIISGSVSGLSGAGLVLQNNGSDNLTINADGSFTFATALADLSSYNVTINTQPPNPAQICSVINAIGGLAGSNITNVNIVCIPPQPQNLQVYSSFSGNTILKWDSLAGITGYTLYWNTTGGVSTTDSSINIGQNTSFLHTLLTLGTTYYYRVTANSAGVESPLSSEVSVISTDIQWANPKPDGDLSYSDIAWNGSVYVATSNGGIITSANGTNWALNVTDNYGGITWNGTQFVAVGIDGAIQTSSDGNIWTLQNSGITANLKSIIWTGSKFVAVGTAGTIITSPDAVSWSTQISGVSTDLNDIIWSGTQFVVVGTNYVIPDLILTSADGISWISQTLPATATDLISVTWTGTQFVAVGVNVMFTSTDGITWMSQGNQGWLYGVTWTGSQLVAVGLTGLIKTSSDGVTWTTQTSGTRNPLHNVIWTGSQLLAVAEHGTIHSSTDAITWSLMNAVTTSEMMAVNWNENQFITVGSLGTILTSPDGNTWTKRSSGTINILSSVEWTGSQYVVVGYNTILTSADGINWVSQISGLTNIWIRKVIWDNNQYIAVGDDGSIIKSPDGINWTPQTSGTSIRLYDIIWSGSQYVAVGGSGATDATIITSPDGITWTSRTPGITSSIYAIAWSGTQFVAGGYGGELITSIDGINWTTQNYETGLYILDIIWTGNRFISTGIFGSSKTSFDGITWLDNDTGTRTANINGIAWTDSKYIIVGIYGAIMVQ